MGPVATTVAESIVNQLLAKKREIELIMDNFEDLKSDLIGMEITYEGDYAVIDHIFIEDLAVRLYVEDWYGDSHYEVIPLEELLPHIRG